MIETTVIGEQVAGESYQVRKQLEALVNNHEKSLFDIGELLHKVKRHGFYQQWGFNTFTEYVESIKFKPRRAQYLARIVSVMSDLGIARESYENLGIAKLREITSLDTEGTWTNPQTGETSELKDWIRNFVERGEELSIEEIKQHVRTLKGLVGENDLVWENFCITRSVKDNIVEPAKELARRNIGSVGKDEDGVSKDASGGACLEVWCVEYLNNPANNVLEEQ